MPDIEIQLEPETEARLTALATARGITLEELAREVICRGIEMEPEAEEGTGEVSDKRICVCGQAIQPGRGVEWKHVISGGADCPDGGTAAPRGGGGRA
jgi:hypothetical protein